MSNKFESKLEILNFIYESREILFGKFSDRLTSEEKMRKWDEVAAKAKQLQIIHDHHDGKYVKDTTWQNWRKRAMQKRDKRNRTGEAGGKFSALDESDELVFQIIGRDSPVLDGINVPESSGSNSSSVGILPSDSSRKESTDETDDENESGERRRKRPGPSKRANKTDFIQDLKAERIQKQVDLCDAEMHMKRLGIYEMEQRLGLGPSEFTKHLYSNQQQYEIVVVDNSENRTS